FVFIVQVRKRYPCSNHSNNVCLIMLPCPRYLCCVLGDVLQSLKSLLLLCGDVESNPGPVELKDIMDKLNVIACDVQEIKTSQKEACRRLGAIEAKLKEIDSVKAASIKQDRKIEKLENTVSTLVDKMDDLENRGRRNNLIIFGLEETENENSNSLEARVSKTIIEDILDVSTSGIERIHRLGSQTPGKARPIILKLLDFRDKLTILRNCSKLRGTNISINEDFSKRVQLIRKKFLDC
ncbi:uncharacterized protein LOC115318140, partial [Ixodes scapularis]|uniref:uncharacterized protein LOC115318140 n=1 Tax=Ixodes scapularis TaxID=6945 RepID=UPI001A9EB99E